MIMVVKAFGLDSTVFSLSFNNTSENNGITEYFKNYLRPILDD